MLCKLNVSRLFLTLCLFASLAFAAFADTIRLKDGGIIKGRIVSFNGGKFVVAVGEGPRRREMAFTAAEIESIQFEPLVSKPEIVTVSDRTAANIVNEDDPQIANTRPPVKVSPQVVSPQTTRQTIPAVKTNKGISNVKPVEIGVKVLADNTGNGWTNSGWVVKKGQKIRITGGGNISLGRGNSTGPSGSYDLTDESKLLKNVPTGALIAVIGDDNNEFIYVGAEREFTATRDGTLFLGVNEGNLNDNSGTFDVKIEIEPA